MFRLIRAREALTARRSHEEFHETFPDCRVLRRRLARACGARRCRARSGTPYEISVILPTTGSGAFLGTHEIAALGVLEKLTNEHGGINGAPLKFVYQDDQTAPSFRCSSRKPRSPSTCRS